SPPGNPVAFVCTLIMVGSNELADPPPAGLHLGGGGRRYSGYRARQDPGGGSPLSSPQGDPGSAPRRGQVGSWPLLAASQAPCRAAPHCRLWAEPGDIGIVPLATR